MKKIIFSAIFALLVVPSFASAADTLNISTVAELRAAISSQADGQTWLITAGDYGLDRFNDITAEGQTGWYFPITANNLTIIGTGNPVIYGTEFSLNGNWSTQNLVSVFGNNVTIKGVTLMPKAQGNKTIEVLGNDITIEDVIIKPNTLIDSFVYDGISNLETRAFSKEWGGSIYFNHAGNHLVKNVTINNGGISFRYSPTGTHITFEGVNIVNKTAINGINSYRFSSGFNEASNTVIGLPQVTYKVDTATNNLMSAIAGAKNGDTVDLISDITVSSQITIDKAITLNGNGNTLHAAFAKTGNSNNSAIGVGTSTVTIKNIKADGTGGSAWPLQLHGINVYLSTGVNLDNVTISNFGGSGVVVNGSNVTATNLNTNGNAWNAVNIDPGSGVNTPSVFTLNGGTLGENIQIWSDGKYVTETANITVTSSGYVKYPVNSVYPTASLWANKDVAGFASITRDSATKLYTSIQSAIDAADSGEVINVASGTYNENLVVNKNLSLRGPNSGVNSQSTRGTEAVINGMVQLSDGPVVAVTFDGFTVNGPAGDTRAIAPGTSIGSKILNNIINVSKRSVQGDYYGRPSNLTIRGNTFNTEYGIAGTEDISDLVIENNVFNTSAEGVGVGEGALITSLSGNKFLGTAVGVYDWRATGLAITASNNWWGVANPDFGTLVSGNVVTSPWYADVAMTTLSSEVKEAEGVKSTVFASESTLSADSVNVVIPAGTTISGPTGWNGIFNLPEVTTTYTIPSESGGFWYKPTLAIELGAGNVPLTFDKPIKLTFTGQAGKSAGWSQNGVFHKIGAECSSPTAPVLDEGKDCKIDVDADLVVWTRHATTFIAFAEQAIPYGGPASSNASYFVVPTTPASQVAQTAVASTPNTDGQVLGTTISEQASSKSQGKVLGASTASFARDMSLGMRGADIEELQKMLIAENLLASEATGFFGALTKAALAQWQEKKGLPATGFFGSMSREALSDKENKKPAVRGVNTFNFTKNLRFGLKGEEVTELQKVLIEKGYLKISTATDYFGPMTKSALVAWQKDNNLPATGYFGAMSREAMLR